MNTKGPNGIAENRPLSVAPGIEMGVFWLCGRSVLYVLALERLVAIICPNKHLPKEQERLMWRRTAHSRAA